MLIFFKGNYSNAQDLSLEWVRQMGGAGADNCFSVDVDDSGNVYTTGIFMDTSDFDPDIDTFNLISFGGSDIFVQKLDASGNLVWVRQIGGTDGERSLAIVADASGNVFITGYFKGTVDFDPGPETFNLTSTSWYGPLANDIFVLKLDALGNLVWAKQMGGFESDIGNSIEIDDSGNVFTTGHFNGTADFDPGPGIFNLSASGSFGNHDIFILKLDTDGNFVWVKQIGGAEDDNGQSLKVDNLGNIFVTGTFSESVDFDPGPDTFIINAVGERDIFVLKLNAAGSLIWVKQMGGIGEDIGESIDLDNLANVYITGSFQGTVDFDPGDAIFNLNAGEKPDVFIQKLDVSGNLLWVKQIGGAGKDRGRSIAVDLIGNVYISGYFKETVDFDPGDAIFNLSSTGLNDAFVHKLDASGNFVWVKKFGGTSNELSYSLAVDETGSVYTVGGFTGTADFDPGPDTINLIPVGLFDIFVLKLSSPTVRVENREIELDVRVYPNPTSKTLQIDKGNHKEIIIHIFDNIGKIISFQTSSNQITRIEMSKYSSGIYYLFISDGVNSTAKKIIKH